MLTPHAILISRNNFYTILSQTSCLLSQLDELWEDGLEEGQSYYLVAQRTPEGLPIYVGMTKEELEKEYDIAVEHQFDTAFAKL